MVEEFILLESTSSKLSDFVDSSSDDDSTTNEVQATKENDYNVQEEYEDFLKTIWQYQTKFLICHVDVKGEKQSTRQMILHNLVRNMRKKTIDFIGFIITNVFAREAEISR